MNYEDYLIAPDAIHRQVFDFLELDPNFIVEKQKLNPSMVVRKTKVSSAIYKVANWLRPYRNYIKPMYVLLRPISERLLGKRKIEKTLDPIKEKEVRDFFSDTYQFLDRLK